MIADVPLGVLLSGGVDSTVIAAIAARNSRDRIKTFTIGYDAGSVSETSEARREAELVGAEHYEITLTQADVATRVPELLGRLDQPLADQALVAMHAVAEFARREVTVVVGGEGADELLGGYPRYRWISRADSLKRTIPTPVAAWGAKALNAAGAGPPQRLSDVLLPQPMLERHLDWVTARRRHIRADLYGPLLRARLTDVGIVDDLSACLSDCPNGDVPARLMRLDQLRWLPDNVLAKADRAGMLVGLEVRTPYLHRGLAELAASVPGETHTRRDGKVLLRTLLSQLVPSAGRGRPKTAFRVPVADWLRGPLAPMLRTQVARGALFEEGWFDRRATDRLVHEHVTGARDWSEALWPLLAFGLWLDRIRGVDGR